ncbi:AMP-binding protein [Enterovirga rhinocerotis]|uniref:Fatty-acyl-CoA synthase n=1 Tax=Enterovirga rhinocerotis TaxID=1339210 RepID=A0A4R7C4I5_9HYPH|nr:AMP-binding protein [Enterovirga rhinocerotis]TDR92923.1 fatty-acyl-CoA synthase [Enterovirga rhinocerotis]
MPNTAIDTFCPTTLQDSLARAAALAPTVEAVVASDGRITYRDLQDRVGLVRSALQALGVRRGDHVAICMGNGIRWIELFFAAGSLGAVTVPINTRLLPDEIRYALRQSRARFLFVASRVIKVDFLAILREVCPAVDDRLPDDALPDLETVIVAGGEAPPGALGWDAFMDGGGAAVEPTASADDTLLIQYTSGTTAFPKGAMLSHRSMLANAFCAGIRVGFRTADRYHSARPFFHVSGSTLSVLAALQHAATLITMDRFEPGEALAQMERERATHFSGNDTMVLMLLDHPERAGRKLHLHGGWIAGAPTVIRRAIDELGMRDVVVAYGLSEASPNVALSCWWEPEVVRVASRVLVQAGLEVRIRDPEEGGDVPADQEGARQGELLIKGWSVMKGYFDKPEETAAALDPAGWLATGDVVRLDAENRLTFVGRAKDIIRVGGENVAPAEIEDILHRHPAVKQAQVVGVPDARLVEVPAAFIIASEGTEPDPDEIIAWSRERMAGFKVPRYVRVVPGFEAIGMTASSKVQKRKLAAHARELFGL